MNGLSSLKPPLMRPRQESINSFTFSCLINNTVISKNIRSGHLASMSSSTDVFILLMWEREGWLVTQSTPACSVSGMILFQDGSKFKSMYNEGLPYRNNTALHTNKNSHPHNDMLAFAQKHIYSNKVNFCHSFQLSSDWFHYFHD